jgi:hypothetical protein
MFKIKVNIPDPLNIHVQKNITTLDIQQSLLLQQEIQRLSMLDRANEHLDNKAINFIQVGTLAVTLVGIFNIPEFLGVATTVAVRIISIVAFLAFGIMVLSSLSIWSPSEYLVPGRREWDQMIDEYLEVSSVGSFYQILSNFMGITDRLQEINSQKVYRLRLSIIMFSIQIICVAAIGFVS